MNLLSNKIVGYSVIVIGTGMVVTVPSYYYIQNYSSHSLNTLSGKDFKKKFPDYKPCKIIGNNENNFQYKLGLNTDTKPFNPTGTCKEGGLYFIDEKNLNEYIQRHFAVYRGQRKIYFSQYGDKVATIEIPNDSKIYMEGCKCKADKFNITKIEPLPQPEYWQSF